MKYVCNKCQDGNPCKLKIREDDGTPMLCPFNSTRAAEWERKGKKLTTAQCQHPAQHVRFKGATLTCSLCGKYTVLGLDGQWSGWV